MTANCGCGRELSQAALCAAVEGFKETWRNKHNDADFVIAVMAIMALLKVIEESRGKWCPSIPGRSRLICVQRAQ